MVTWLEMVSSFKNLYRKDMDNFIAWVNKVIGTSWYMKIQFKNWMKVGWMEVHRFHNYNK
jgi:hypothetical protein